jgi:hypothetical protein
MLESGDRGRAMFNVNPALYWLGQVSAEVSKTSVFRYSDLFLPTFLIHMNRRRIVAREGRLCNRSPFSVICKLSPFISLIVAYILHQQYARAT